MKKRKLRDIEVSEIGMGCMAFSHGYGQIPPEEYSVEAIRGAYEAGCTFFDTAEVYSPNLSGIGHNEKIVGKALEDVRDNVVIATKLFLRVLPGAGVYKTVKRHLTDSMKRLRTDRVDLYYYEYVTALTKDGVINGMGDGTFAPDGTLTWAQAMKLLLCAHGDLADVTGDKWADTAMSKAAQLGLCGSEQDGSEEITRLDFCTAAAKLFGLASDGTGTAFSDCGDPSVLALADAGVINGYPDGTFGPAKTLTRAEISKIIFLLMKPD